MADEVGDEVAGAPSGHPGGDSTAFYEIYDLLHASKDYDAEVATVLGIFEHATGHAPSRVIEVGCGTGSHTLAFARRGVPVLACDLERPAIERARARAAAAGVEAGGGGVTFVHGDAAAIEPVAAPLAVAMFNVVNYVTTRPALDAFFAAIARHQPPSIGERGLLVFDAWNGVAALRDPPRVEERDVEVGGGRLQTTLTPTLDLVRERVGLAMTATWTPPEGPPREVRFDYTHRLWTPETIRESLASTGYYLESVDRWMSPGEPAGPDDWKVLITASRR